MEEFIMSKLLKVVIGIACVVLTGGIAYVIYKMGKAKTIED
jgi:hypothetical protein